MTHNNITIVGAGIPGLTAACLLADLGCVVTVVEARTLPTESKPTTRTAAVMQGSLDILKQTGVWDDFESQTTALTGLTIIDDSRFPRGGDHMVKQAFKSYEIDQDAFGYNVSLLDLTIALANRAKMHENITIHEQTEITKTHKLITGADLVIGADGRKSSVREWSGIDADEKQYGQSAITCVISHDKSHENTSTEFHRSGGPCTFVPYGENQSGVVWVENHDDSDEFMRLPRDGFIHALQERSRGILGQIDLVVEPNMCPLISLRAQSFTAPRTVLMAEAAHVLSPIGAQGLNLSLRDVGAVVNAVRNALTLGQDIGGDAVLSEYERVRRDDLNLRTRGVDGFHQMVANDNPFIANLRRLGLKVVGLPTPLRLMLMEQGLKASV